MYLFQLLSHHIPNPTFAGYAQKAPAYIFPFYSRTHPSFPTCTCELLLLYPSQSLLYLSWCPHCTYFSYSLRYPLAAPRYFSLYIPPLPPRTIPDASPVLCTITPPPVPLPVIPLYLAKLLPPVLAPVPTVPRFSYLYLNLLYTFPVTTDCTNIHCSSNYRLYNEHIAQQDVGICFVHNKRIIVGRKPI
jgi:hypothetical protein